MRLRHLTRRLHPVCVILTYVFVIFYTATAVHCSLVSAVCRLSQCNSSPDTWHWTVQYCRTPFFRCILISRFSCVENSLHFNFADFPVGPILARMHSRYHILCTGQTASLVDATIDFISAFCCLLGSGKPATSSFLATEE